MHEELKYLWKEKRPEVTQKVAQAAALGDRSENAEYIYGKRQLAEIDRRIRYLSKRLDEINVVDRTPTEVEKVYFGAWVTVADAHGEARRYRIVGPDEFDQHDAYISMDAPLARAMLGKRAGDELVVRLEDTERTVIIEEISYES